MQTTYANSNFEVASLKKVETIESDDNIFI